MIEIQHRVPATVVQARELARSQFGAAVRRFNDDPTVANFEHYRHASRWLEAIERAAADSENAEAPWHEPDRPRGIAA
jgi:hypothetical protein